MSTRLVVICPGMGPTPGPQAVIEPCARRFRDQGYDTKTLFYSGHGALPIQYYTEQLHDYVTAVRDQYEHITLLGHSLGGIIAREALHRYQTPGDAYVSLASPHRGYRKQLETLLGWLCPSLDQLRQNSTYFTHLGPWTTPTPALFCIAERDALLETRCQSPYDDDETGEFQKSNVENLRRQAGHLSIASAEETFWEVWAWLTFNDDPDENLLFFEGQGNAV